jgi:hypothetical protein
MGRIIEFKKKVRPWWASPELWEQDIPTLEEWHTRRYEIIAINNVRGAAMRWVSLHEQNFLTTRQLDAIRLAREAMRRDISDVMGFVARYLGVQRPAASKLLTRADSRFEEQLAQIIELMPAYVEYPREEALKTRVHRARLYIRRRCAAQGVARDEHLMDCKVYTPDGSKPLCITCYKEWGGNMLTWPDWLIFLSRDIDREVYREARTHVQQRRFDSAA